MRRFYVDVSNVPRETLELVGFQVVKEDEEFLVLSLKGEEYVLEKARPYLFLEDYNDAIILTGARVHPAPPADDAKKS